MNKSLLITLIIVGTILLLVVIPLIIMFLYTNKIAKTQYFKQLVRNEPGKWGRECSDTTNEEQVRMYNEGIKWSESKPSEDVEITNDGFKLVGKYLKNPIKNDKCVIVIPGRTESLLYSYYFSMPYYEAGFNVLVIDNRSHGLSEGTLDCLGLVEYRDILKWSELLKNKFNIKHVILHGICIGAATSVYAKTLTNEKTIIDGLVLDGIYTNFKETFKNHIIYEHHPVFPVCDEVMRYIKKYNKVDVVHNGPDKYIAKVDCPVLFLYSKEDKFSQKYMADYMINTCASPYKEVKWFDKGAHSHIRINNQKIYDEIIINFLNKYYK